MKMVAAQIFGGRNDAFLNTVRRMKSRRINLLSIAIALATISTANVCHATDGDYCASALKDYLDGGQWTNRLFAHPPCDERRYEDLKNSYSCSETMIRKFQEAHSLCQSVKATQRDFDDCNQMDDAKRTKIGCTRVFNDQSQSLIDRIFAFVQLGNSYVKEERDLGRATYYYGRAIQMDPRGALSAYAARAVVYWKMVYHEDGDHSDNPNYRRYFEEATADYRSAYAIDAAKMDELTASSEDLQQIKATVRGTPGAKRPPPKRE